jgi:outer membrane protein TolC
VGAALVVPLETAGKRELRSARASAAVDVKEWEFATTLWTVRAEIRQACFSWLLARRLAAADAQEIELRAQFLAWVDVKIEYGVASTADRLAPLQDLFEAEARRDQDRAALASSATALAGALGISPDRFADVQPVIPGLDRLPEPTESQMAGLRRDAVLNRSDVRGALAAYQATEQDLILEVAKQYPDIAIGPGYTYDQGDDKITLTLDLPIPLLHGQRAAIDVALAERRAAAARFEAAQAGALSDVEAGLARYRVSLSTLKSARSAAAAGHRAVVAARQRLLAGASDHGEALVAEINAATRDRQVLEALRSAVEALGRIESAVQRPIFPASTLGAVRPSGPTAAASPP